MMKLTERQRELLELLQRAQRPPTYREIGAALGIASTNGVMDHLKALERKGYILLPREMTARQPIRILKPLDYLPLGAEGTVELVREALTIPGSADEVVSAIRAIVHREVVERPPRTQVPKADPTITLAECRVMVLAACRDNRYLGSMAGVAAAAKLRHEPTRRAVDSLIADGSLERVNNLYYRTTERFREHRATQARETRES